MTFRSSLLKRRVKAISKPLNFTVAASLRSQFNSSEEKSRNEVVQVDHLSNDRKVHHTQWDRCSNPGVPGANSTNRDFGLAKPPTICSFHQPTYGALAGKWFCYGARSFSFPSFFSSRPEESIRPQKLREPAQQFVENEEAQDTKINKYAPISVRLNTFVISVNYFVWNGLFQRIH